LAVNVGGPEVSFSGQTYIADHYATGGDAYVSSDPISGGDQILTGLDLFAEVGHDAAYTYSVPNIAVNDGSLSIAIDSVVDNGTLSGFAIYSNDGGETVTPEPPVSSSTGQNHRIFVTTDLGGDPDDDQSMVHLLVAANEFDIEGLVLGLGWLNAIDEQLKPARMNAIFDAYEQVLPNLKTHGGDGYPSADYLRSKFAFGQPRAKMSAVGNGKDSAGSNLLIEAIDKDDSRPLWINAWGGGNTIAQALWTLKATRSAKEMDDIISKIRVYDILGQDDAGAWMTKTFPNLIYIRNTKVYGWAPSDSWTSSNVQSHGPMGRVYQSTKWATEGDSPAFFHVWNNGLNDPDQIDQGGWGGRFSWNKQAGVRVFSAVSGVNESTYDTYRMHISTSEGIGVINRWKQHIHNDMQARMDWTINSNYSSANHHPVAIVNNDNSKKILEINAQAGASVTLSANGSSDPDGHALSYKWYFYDEPSSHNGSVTIQNSSRAGATVSVPSNARGKTLHIILELSDNGSPRLTSYRRVIINVQ